MSNEPESDSRNKTPKATIDGLKGEFYGLLQDILTWIRLLIGRGRRVQPSRIKLLIFNLIASAVLSRVLQSLTRDALWLPATWRLAVTFASSIVFLSIFEIAAELKKALLKQAKERSGRSKKMKASNELKLKILQYSLILLSLAMFVSLLWVSNERRSKSVWYFNPPPVWWAKQFGTIPTAVFPTNYTETPSLRVPEFINQSEKAIYFPDEIPDQELSNYLVKIGDHNLRNGIKITLDEEPMTLIDWAQGAGADIRKHYSTVFFLLHFGMIISLSVAWGLYNKPGEVAKDALTDPDHSNLPFHHPEV